MFWTFVRYRQTCAIIRLMATQFTDWIRSAQARIAVRKRLVERRLLRDELTVGNCWLHSERIQIVFLETVRVKKKSGRTEVSSQLLLTDVSGPRLWAFLAQNFSEHFLRMSFFDTDDYAH